MKKTEKKNDFNEIMKLMTPQIETSKDHYEGNFVKSYIRFYPNSLLIRRAHFRRMLKQTFDELTNQEVTNDAKLNFIFLNERSGKQLPLADFFTKIVFSLLIRNLKLFKTFGETEHNEIH